MAVVDSLKHRMSNIKNNDPDLEKVSERRLLFIQHYIDNGGDARQAWLDAGYAVGGVANAKNLLRDNYKIVEKLIKLKINSHVPMALAGVVELAQNAKQESVRLKALQDILFRAGYDKPMEIVTSEKAPEELKESELDKELTRLLARVNDEAVNKEEMH